MTPTEFQGVCEGSGFQILEKINTKHGNVLLAERKTTHPDYARPFWETLWALERGECDIARVVRNDERAEQKGIFRTITQRDRIADAKNAADQFIGDNLKIGRYT